MTNEIKIGNVTIKPNLALAPMAGVTDSSFRRLIKELGGVGLIVTEFISVEGITRGNYSCGMPSPPSGVVTHAGVSGPRRRGSVESHLDWPSDRSPPT